MSEIINIEIQADQSGAEEALKQVNKSLKEGTEAAESLNHVLDGDLAGAFKSLGELSKTLGIELDLAFSPAEIIAFVQVIAEVADKLSKLIADTFIYTDAMKEQDKVLASANKSLEASAARVKALGRETQLAAEKSEVGKEKLRLQFKLEDLGGDPKALKAKMDQAMSDLAGFKTQLANLTSPLSSAKALTGQDGAYAEWSKQVDAAKAKIADLENQINAYAAAIRVADAETKKTGQTISNDLSAAADKAAKDEQARHDKFVAMVYAERQAMQDKATAHETAEAQETIAVFAETEKQNQAIIKAAQEQTKVWDKGYQDQIQDAKDASNEKIAQITQDFERGKINQQQEIAEIAAEKQKELALEKVAQEARWALWDRDPVKRKEIEGQIAKIVSQAKTIETKAVSDGLKAQEQQYKQVFSQIGNAFKTEIMGMIQGTETVAQGFAKMFNSLIGSFADYVAQKAEKKAEEWAIDKLFHTKSVVAETGAATGKAMTSSFASVMSALPFPANVAAAPGVAAAAGAQATGFGLAGLAAMFELGGIVPHDGLAYLHKDEKIIPASKSGTGAGLDGIGGITVVVNHSVSAVDAASFQGHIRRHGNMIANEVTRALKRKGIR
jgi:chromosome segregation ATPase